VKKNHRPAQVVFDYTIQRRTSEQIKADQAKAKTDAAAAEAATAAHLQSQRDQVAAVEDAKQVEEYTQSLEDLRPDLHIGNKSASNTDVDTLSNSHLILDDNPLGIPAPTDWSSRRGSSQGDNNFFGDYVIESDNDDESEASQALSPASDASLQHRLEVKRTAKAKLQHKVSIYLIRSAF
jgi:hypothetical protein